MVSVRGDICVTCLLVSLSQLSVLLPLYFLQISKDGQGRMKAWQQQIQQLKNVSADMAAAIVAVYPSPHSLAQVKSDNSPMQSQFASCWFF